MSAIPQTSRDLVRARAHQRCERCGVPAPRGHWHHRRSRRVTDAHTHCACNGVWLCPACHVWVHAHPTEARDAGFLVSQWVMFPAHLVVHTMWGTRRHECSGTFTAVN